MSGCDATPCLTPPISKISGKSVEQIWREHRWHILEKYSQLPPLNESDVIDTGMCVCRLLPQYINNSLINYVICDICPSSCLLKTDPVTLSIVKVIIRVVVMRQRICVKLCVKFKGNRSNLEIWRERGWHIWRETPTHPPIHPPTHIQNFCSLREWD